MVLRNSIFRLFICSALLALSFIPVGKVQAAQNQENLSCDRELIQLDFKIFVTSPFFRAAIMMFPELFPVSQKYEYVPQGPHRTGVTENERPILKGSEGRFSDGEPVLIIDGPAYDERMKTLINYFNYPNYTSVEWISGSTIKINSNSENSSNALTVDLSEEIYQKFMKAARAMYIHFILKLETERILSNGVDALKGIYQNDLLVKLWGHYFGNQNFGSLPVVKGRPGRFDNYEDIYATLKDLSGTSRYIFGHFTPPAERRMSSKSWRFLGQIGRVYSQSDEGPQSDSFRMRNTWFEAGYGVNIRATDWVLPIEREIPAYEVFVLRETLFNPNRAAGFLGRGFRSISQYLWSRYNHPQFLIRIYTSNYLRQIVHLGRIVEGPFGPNVEGLLLTDLDKRGLGVDDVDKIEIFETESIR